MKNRPLCSVCLILLLAAVIRVVVGGERLVLELRPSALERLAKDKESITVRGRLSRIEEKSNGQMLTLIDNSIKSKKSSFQEEAILIYLDSKNSEAISIKHISSEKISPEEISLKELHLGNQLEVKGEVSFYQNARNPGNFDQKRYYQTQNIHGMVWGKSCSIVSDDRWKLRDSLFRFRTLWKQKMEVMMGEKDGATLAAMILGEKSGMDPEQKELYQVNGIGHILAVSGLHLSLIGIGMYRILRRLTGSYQIGGIAGILFLFCYILMIGLTVSAVRALVMFLFRVGADITGRHYDSVTALAVSAVCVLCWRPLYLYDGGFWLSFGAVFAVVFVLPVLEKFFLSDRGRKSDMGKKKRDGRKEGERVLVKGFLASAGIQIVLLPIQISCFFELPVYAVLLNLYVIPLMSVLLVVGIFGSVFAFLGTAVFPVAKMCFGISSGILELYEESCRLALGFPGARVIAGQPSGWKIIAYYVVLLAVLGWMKRKTLQRDQRKPRKKERKQEDFKGRTVGCVRRMIGGMSLFLLTAFLLIPEKAQGFCVTFLDVGQGDGIFLRGPDGTTYLADGGSSDVKQVGKYRIEPFLKAQGCGKLDYVFVSHGDQDHLNGISELIGRRRIGVKIGTLVLPVREVWDKALLNLAKQAQKAGITVAEMEPGQKVTEGEMEIVCIQPEKESRLEQGNAASMVLAVTYGEFDLLLTGDVEKEGEELLTDRMKRFYGNKTLDVLKAAHHGSGNSSAKEFLETVSPKYAVISAGVENRYGHPHKETLQRLKESGSIIYSTQTGGAISVWSDGKRMCFYYPGKGVEFI